MSEKPRMRLRLPQAMRLQHTREFASIRDQGQRLVKGCLIANWLRLPSGSVSRVGLVASRKIGKAVVRNRARRLLREAFRLHQHDFQEPVAMVLVARSSIVGKRFSEVERDFLSVLKQGKLLKRNE